MLFGFLELLLDVNPAWSGDIVQTWSLLPFQTGLAGPSTLAVRYSCFDAFTLREINCTFTHRILGLKDPTDPANNGGHAHYFATHPVIDPHPNGKLLFNGLQFDPTVGIQPPAGHTLDTGAIIHKMPQAAGKIVTETIVTLPRGYLCLPPDCLTFNSWRYVTTLDVGVASTVGPGVPDLVSLPGSTTFHITIRSDASKVPHPDGTFGTQRTITLLELIAQKYCKEFVDIETDINSCQNARRRLSINDLSLRKGGVFDLCSTWNPSDTCPNPDVPGKTLKGHSTHRIGTDADINNKDEGGNLVGDCVKGSLQKAVASILPPGDALVCEPGGGKHVDFD